MKKIILIISFLLTINIGFAASANSSFLDNIENSLYGFTYTTADDASRLSRIEESVYGQSKTNKSISERMASLKKDMAADLIGQEIAPKEDTFADEQDSYKEEKLAQEKLPPAGANVDYPSINELEKQVFKKEFKTKDLNSRLASLEKQALGQTFDNEPFANRVDRLQAKIKPKSFMNNNIAEFDYDSYNASTPNPSKVNLASVEKSIFKKTFNQEPIENRISRLESTMFGTTFNSDSEQTRINRISSAYKATKTAGKYDSNKFSQNMATAMQIGTILLMILACVL